MKLSVLVPTYRRVDDFERCLQALAQQQRMPDEIVIVAQESDAETHAVLPRWAGKLPLQIVSVHQGGQVHALNAGLDQVRGDIVMITDDDAAPYPDWCSRVEQHFVDGADVGGVGGRDIVQNPEGPLDGHAKVIGRVRPWGQITGNHHWIAPAVTAVDVLKGANMSYRMSAVGDLRFDTNLRGAGAQVGNDMAFSMAVAKRGWKLLYDPEVRVDHFPAQRMGPDLRNRPTLGSAEDTAFNTWWTLRRHFRRGPRRASAMLWESAVGTWGRPGWVRNLLAMVKRDRALAELCAAARKGRREASRSARNTSE